MSELTEALAQHDINLPTDRVDLIDRYCHSLWSWNERINLTRHTEFDRFVSRDLIDSLQLAQLLKAGEEVLDLGTGGGVPGILVAVLRPDIQVSLCESVRKRAHVVDSIVNELKLPIPVYHARGEDIIEDFRFTTVMARAVGPLAKILSWVESHWISIGRLLLVKGPRWVAERGEARHLGLLQELELRRMVSYAMPGTDSQSVILELRKQMPA